MVARFCYAEKRLPLTLVPNQKSLLLSSCSFLEKFRKERALNQRFLCYVASMEPRLNIVTLGVQDVNRSVQFYQRLGWKPSAASAGDIAFFSLRGVVLALYPKEALAQDAQVPKTMQPGCGSITLAQNVRTPEEVDEVLAHAVRAGATLLKPAQAVFWGGRSGYFADPDGHPWEVAWNPHFVMDATGSLQLP